MLQAALHLSRQHINLTDSINLVPKKLYADSCFAKVRREYLNCITSHAEGTAMEVHIISRILDIHQRTDDIFPTLLHTRSDGHHHTQIVLRAAQAIDTGHRRHYNNVPTFHQRSSSRKAQFINLFVNRRVFCNISISLRHIGLRLVIIVV